jgi:transposase-like protein
VANKTKFDYLPLFKAYENGEMTVAEISRKYNINRTSFFNCYKRYKEKIDSNIAEAEHHLDKGLKAFENAVTNINNQKKEAENKKGQEREILLKQAEANKQQLERTINTLENSHGILAHQIIQVSSKGLTKAFELLGDTHSAQELADITKSLKSITDALGIMPRQPMVAIQNNINSQGGANSDKKLEISVNFLNAKDNKNDKDDGIIEVEAK